MCVSNTPYSQTDGQTNRHQQHGGIPISLAKTQIKHQLSEQDINDILVVLA